MPVAKKDKPNIHYMHPGMWPVHIGFAFIKADFDKEIARLGVTDAPNFVTPGANATTHTLIKDGQKTIIVCFDFGKKVSRSQVLGLICHESCHVWNEVCDAMRGTCPGGEHQAYGVQWIAQCIAEKAWRES